MQVPAHNKKSKSHKAGIYDQQQASGGYEKRNRPIGIWITDTLTWSVHTHDRCVKANKMLGFLRRSSMEISDVKIRRTLYLAIVRSALGYSSQVWSPQSIELITRKERIQRRATKYILKLPFACAETYQDRLIS